MLTIYILTSSTKFDSTSQAGGRLQTEAGKFISANESVAQVNLSIYHMFANVTVFYSLANIDSLANINELRQRITKTNIADMFAILFFSGFSERTSSLADISEHSLADKRGELRGYVRCFTAETFCQAGRVSYSWTLHRIGTYSAKYMRFVRRNRFISKLLVHLLSSQRLLLRMKKRNNIYGRSVNRGEGNRGNPVPSPLKKMQENFSHFGKFLSEEGGGHKTA